VIVSPSSISERSPLVTSNDTETDRAIRRMEAAGLSGDEARRAAALDLAIRRTMQEPR